MPPRFHRNYKRAT